MESRLLMLCLHMLGWLYNRVNDKYYIIEHVIKCTVERYNDIVDSQRSRYIKKTGNITEAIQRYRYTTASSWLMNPKDIAIRMIIKDV